MVATEHGEFFSGTQSNSTSMTVFVSISFDDIGEFC